MLLCSHLSHTRESRGGLRPRSHSSFSVRIRPPSYVSSRIRCPSMVRKRTEVRLVRNADRLACRSKPLRTGRSQCRSSPGWRYACCTLSSVNPAATHLERYPRHSCLLEAGSCSPRGRVPRTISPTSDDRHSPCVLPTQVHGLSIANATTQVHPTLVSHLVQGAAHGLISRTMVRSSARLPGPYRTSSRGPSQGLLLAIVYHWWLPGDSCIGTRGLRIQDPLWDHNCSI
jgi:hypothetical protein